MATDSGIVTIYDLENGGKSLTAHRIDARQFLAHPSKRWSATPPEGAKKPEPEPADTESDDGEAMKLKEMSFKALQALAQKAALPGWAEMKKAELVTALLPTTK